MIKCALKSICMCFDVDFTDNDIARAVDDTFANFLCRRRRNISKRFSFAHASVIFVITASFILLMYHK